MNFRIEIEGDASDDVWLPDVLQALGRALQTWGCDAHFTAGMSAGPGYDERHRERIEQGSQIPEENEIIRRPAWWDEVEGQRDPGDEG